VSGDRSGAFSIGAPYGFDVTCARVLRSVAVLNEFRRVKAEFSNLLTEQLRKSPTRDVVLYVHGFNVTFETAALTMAELYRFFGREHVCAIFAWPASASGNLVTSYATTTESATCAVGHPAETIRLITRTSGARRTNSMAHNLGSAPLLSAIESS